MVSVARCEPEPDAPSSSAGARKAESDSRFETARYQRLRSSLEYERAFRTGTRRRRGGVTVIAAQRGSGPARFGLVVGRKVGGAVERNRAKRRLREAINRADLSPGVDYVVIAASSVVTAPFVQLVEWVRAAVEERV
jgi:ribonuclease P protein component